MPDPTFDGAVHAPAQLEALHSGLVGQIDLSTERVGWMGEVRSTFLAVDAIVRIVVADVRASRATRTSARSGAALAAAQT